MAEQINILWILPAKQKGSLYSSYRDTLKKFGIFIEFIYLREITLDEDINVARQSAIRAASSKDMIFVTLFPDTIEVCSEFLNQLRKKAKLILVSCDDEIYFSSFTYMLVSNFDAVITTDMASIFYIRDIGVDAYYIPFQNLNSINYRIECARDIDVVFIGAINTDQRSDLVKFIEDGGINIEAYGSGTPNGFIEEGEYWELLQKSKICLNFTGVKHNAYIQNNDAWKVLSRQAKGRPFEALSVGTVVLSENSEFLKEAAKKLKGVHFFNNHTELLLKIKELIQSYNELESKKIIELVNNQYGPQSYANLFTKILIETGNRVSPRTLIVWKSKSYLLYRSKIYISLIKFCVFNKNYFGAFILTREVINKIIRQKRLSNRRGHI